MMYFAALQIMQNELVVNALNDPIVTKLFWTISSIVLIYVSVLILVRIFNRVIEDPHRQHRTRKWLCYVGAALVLFILIGIWSDSLGQIALTLGVLGAGIALALQAPVVNMAGWLFIVMQRPYEIGDRIEIEGLAGDVIDIRLFKTVLLEIHAEGMGKGSQSTGRVADFPNSLVFSNKLYNYTRGFEYLWNEYPILITFESNWSKAEEILLQILDKHTVSFESGARREIEEMSKSYLIRYGALTPIVQVILRDSGIELGMRYLTPARDRRTVRDSMSKEILEAFEAEKDIELAYPTYRIFRRDIEEQIGDLKI